MKKKTLIIIGVLAAIGIAVGVGIYLKRRKESQVSQDSSKISSTYIDDETKAYKDIADIIMTTKTKNGNSINWVIEKAAELQKSGVDKVQSLIDAVSTINPKDQLDPIPQENYQRMWNIYESYKIKKIVG